MMPRILAIIPAYNEEASLPGLIPRLTSVVPRLDLLVVNDGSTDRTMEILRRLPTRVVSLPTNSGIGAAVQTGLKIANLEDYDYAIQVDGDGQHTPEQIPILLDEITKTHADLVVGSRFRSNVEGTFRSTFTRRVGIRLFSFVLSAVCKTRITDATSGFRIMNRRAIGLLSGSYAEDWPEVEALLTVHRNGLRISEVPVQMSKRQGGKSSIGFIAEVRYMVKVPLAILMGLLRTRGSQTEIL